MKLVIFIHTCKAYEESRAKLLEQTWANSSDIVFITDNQQCQLKNFIYIGPYEVVATYPPKNLIKMINLFLERYSDYDFFMMIDDDSYLYLDKLKLYLSFFNKDHPYMIGDFLNWTNQIGHRYGNLGNKYDQWVGGGPGIVFTKSCIEKLIPLLQRYIIPPNVNHDVALHMIFNVSDHTIRRVHCPGFHQFGADKLFETIPKESNQLISVHLNRDMSLLSKYHV